ncbi:MAG: glycosyl hydrolase, partial [Acidobacteria bacterium]
ARVGLLDRLIQHARATAEFSVYYGRGRDGYDVRGRVAHESLFNAANGSYRGPNSQQGYSPFTTWTRGLAWAMLGFAEQLEFLDTVDDDSLTSHGGRAAVEQWMLDAACATSDYYMEIAASDGIPYWDSGAPNLEPVDSSAAAIGAQGLLRLARILEAAGRQPEADLYRQAGLRVVETLFEETGPYLSTDSKHQGLILHSVYHWPNRWDHVPEGATTPRGESSQWGDYHAREAALYVQRLACNGPYLAFFGGDRVQAAA